MLVNALHNIANSRPSLLPKAIPYLIAIQQRPPLALTNNPQLHSIQYVLRMAMLDILKYPHHSAALLTHQIEVPCFI